MVPLPDVYWGQSNVHAFIVQLCVSALLGCLALVVGWEMHHWALNKVLSSPGWKDLIHPLKDLRGKFRVLIQEGTILWAAFRLKTTQWDPTRVFSLSSFTTNVRLGNLRKHMNCFLGTTLCMPRCLFSGDFPPVPQLFSWWSILIVSSASTLGQSQIQERVTCY